MDPKRTFLNAEFQMLAWNASVRRNRTYAQNTSRSEKFEFRSHVINHLESQIEGYSTSKSSEEHLANLKRLEKCTVNKFGHLLYRKRPVGFIQKFFNLTLKYRWCIGEIDEPPHCPLDGIILSRIGYEGPTWTTWDSWASYENAIDQVVSFAKAEDKTPSQFELDEFSRR